MLALQVSACGMLRARNNSSFIRETTLRRKLLVFSAKFSSVTAMASGSLAIMLDRRNRWEQSITLELFNGVKDTEYTIWKLRF